MFDQQLNMVNTALRLGEPITRWKRAINVAIPKQIGNLDISKFRNIHIYECDLNAMLSIKWKEALNNSEDTDQMISQQYGSRQGKSSLDPVQIEILLMDLTRVTRATFGQINYDAKACYDRILPNLAAMASKAHGIPTSIVNLHYKLLQDMVYEIQVEGTTEIVQYKNECDSPVYGTGQGSGNSPTIWTFISNVLLKSLENQAIGAKYYSGSNTEVSIKSTAFVDDVNTYHTGADLKHLDIAMTHDYELWQKILKSSGGTLAPEKCNHYKIEWTFKPSGRPVMKVAAKGDIDEFSTVDPR